MWLECPVRSVVLGTASIMTACTAIFLGMSTLNAILA